MAKKKKKAEAAGSDEAKPATKKDAAPVDAAASSAAVATLPVGSVAISKRDVEHFLAVQRKTKEAELKWAEADHYKEMKKIAAAEAKSLDAEIRRMIRNGPDDPALFDKHEEPETNLATDPNGQTIIPWDLSPHADAATSGDGRAAAGDESANDAWRTAPLFGTLKQPKKATLDKALKMLEDSGRETIGDLEMLRSAGGVNWYQQVPGLGHVGAEEVNEAVNAWLATTRDKAEFEKARGDSVAAEAAPTLTFDLMVDVVRYLRDAQCFKSDAKAAGLKKALGGTMLDATAIGVVYRCDDDGIHIDSLRGRKLPVDANTITYKQAAEILKGLATNPVKTKYAGEPRIGELVKYFVERWGIAVPLNAGELESTISPAAGTHNGTNWETSHDGVQIHFPDLERGLVLTYDEVAELVKLRLDEML